MKKTTILCVGIGGYANVYLESLLNQENPDFEIVGTVDISKEYCRFASQLEEIPFYNNMEDFYKEHKADLCIITTPIHLHTRQILCALKNGSNVLCEKPLSADPADEKLINSVAEEMGKFVMIGYQWSYSEAVNSLKKDIMDGVYGEPQFMKSLVLWPRDTDYFNRGSGWAGKLKASDGTPINDSVANNATAHYLHNIFYVNGTQIGKSCEAVSVKADLIRTNAIENFDTAVIWLELENGAKGLFIASHSTKQTIEPRFEYQYSNGTIYYDDNQKMIVGKTNDGAEKEYGNPFKDVNEKVYEAIAACQKADYKVPCGVTTAAAHVRCIEMVQQFKIWDANPDFVRKNGKFLYIDGLDEILLQCYRAEKLLSDSPVFKRLVKGI